MANACTLLQKYKPHFELLENSVPRLCKAQYRNQHYGRERLWEERKGIPNSVVFSQVACTMLENGTYLLLLSDKKIKEKQQVGLKFPNFQWLSSSGGGYLLTTEWGENTVHTMILKIPGDFITEWISSLGSTVNSEWVRYELTSSGSWSVGTANWGCRPATVGRKKGADLGTLGGSLGLLRSWKTERWKQMSGVVFWPWPTLCGHRQNEYSWKRKMEAIVRSGILTLAHVLWAQREWIQLKDRKMAVIIRRDVLTLVHVLWAQREWIQLIWEMMAVVSTCYATETIMWTQTWIHICTDRCMCTQTHASTHKETYPQKLT